MAQDNQVEINLENKMGTERTEKIIFLPQDHREKIQFHFIFLCDLCG